MDRAITAGRDDRFGRTTYRETDPGARKLEGLPLALTAMPRATPERPA